MKTDWLTEFHHVLLVAAIGAGSVCVLGTVAVLARDEIVVPVHAAEVTVADPTVTQIALGAAAALPTYLLATVVLLLLHRLVGAARRGDPLFGGRTLRRIRTVGWLLLVGGPVVCAVEFVARFALSGTVGDDGIYAEFDPALVAIWALAGFGMLAVGEIVRQGRDLRAELDEVI